MSKPEALYVITLLASSMPVPLPVLDEERLTGLAAFRSRRIEDGRERFRIHVGYFNSAEQAESILPLLRETYPWAFVGPAPRNDLGSLEDTGRARFRIVQPAQPVPGEARAEVRAAAPAVAAAPEPRVASTAAEAAGSEPAAPLAATRAAPGAAVPPLLPLSDAVVVPEAKPKQHYAVQLLWSNKPIDLSKIPNSGAFDGHLLYAVETRPGGRRMYGVRLGFYEDALAARLVAQHVRPTFKGVVIPVSEREVEYASNASIRIAGSRQSRASSSMARDGWPRSAVSVAFISSVPQDSTAQL